MHLQADRFLPPVEMTEVCFGVGIIPTFTITHVIPNAMRDLPAVKAPEC